MTRSTSLVYRGAFCTILGGLACASTAQASLTITADQFFANSQSAASAPAAQFSIRGLAVAKDGSGDVYFSHIQKASADNTSGLSAGSRHLVRLNSTGNTVLNSVAVSTQAKAIETDSLGRVYATGYSGFQPGVYVYNADLTPVTGNNFIPVAGAVELDGVGVYEQGGNVYMTVSDRDEFHLTGGDVFVRQYAITSSLSGISGTQTWNLTLPSSSRNLRGVTADASGNIYVGDYGYGSTAGAVYKIASDGSSILATAAIGHAQDLVVMGNRVFVTTQSDTPPNYDTPSAGGNSLVESFFTSDLSTDQSFSLSAASLQSYFGLGGIDTINNSSFPGMEFLVANEDATFSSLTNTYTDTILLAHAPEPASLVLLMMGSTLILRRRAARA